MLWSSFRVLRVDDTGRHCIEGAAVACAWCWREKGQKRMGLASGVRESVYDMGKKNDPAYSNRDFQYALYDDQIHTKQICLPEQQMCKNKFIRLKSEWKKSKLLELKTNPQKQIRQKQIRRVRSQQKVPQPWVSTRKKLRGRVLVADIVFLSNGRTPRGYNFKIKPAASGSKKKTFYVKSFWMASHRHGSGRQKFVSVLRCLPCFHPKIVVCTLFACVLGCLLVC